MAKVRKEMASSRTDDAASIFTVKQRVGFTTLNQFFLCRSFKAGQQRKANRDLAAYLYLVVAEVVVT